MYSSSSSKQKPTVRKTLTVATRFAKCEVSVDTFHYAAKQIMAWRKIAKAARWRNFVEVRQVFKDADDVKGYVIFNIRQSRYRLVTIIHYSRVKDGGTTAGSHGQCSPDRGLFR